MPASVSDYVHPVGDFTLLGPVRRDLLCTLGLPCELALHDAPSAKALALWTQACGSGTPAEWTPAAVSVPVNVTPAVGVPGYPYRLCWAAVALRLRLRLKRKL